MRCFTSNTRTTGVDIDSEPEVRIKSKKEKERERKERQKQKEKEKKGLELLKTVSGGKYDAKEINGNEILARPDSPKDNDDTKKSKGPKGNELSTLILMKTLRLTVKISL